MKRNIRGLRWALETWYTSAGWVDPTTDSGRKESDCISYSQFMEGTGIGGRSTLSRALTDCMEKGYLLREQVGEDPRSRKPLYAYALNTEYRPASSPEMGPLEKPTEDQVSSPKMGLLSSPEIGPLSSPKTGLTKEKKETTSKDIVVASLLEYGVGGAVKKIKDHGAERCASVLAYVKEHGLGPAWVAHTLESGEPVPGPPGDDGDREARERKRKYGQFAAHSDQVDSDG